MIAKNLMMLFGVELVAAVAFSPQVVDLDSTKLQRDSGCAAAGVVNGQCGHYYRSGGCNDEIGKIGPGVCSTLSHIVSLERHRLTHT